MVKINLNKKQKKKSKLGNEKRNILNTKVGSLERLFVNNLSFKCNKEKLKEVFSKYGDIAKITLPRNSSRKLRGFGIVSFNSSLSANKATEALSGKEFMGRVIHIEKFEGGRKKLNLIDGNHAKNHVKPVKDAEQPSENGKLSKGENDRQIKRKRKQKQPNKTKHKENENKKFDLRVDDKQGQAVEEEDSEKESINLKQKKEFSTVVSERKESGATNVNKRKKEKDLKQPHEISTKKKARLIIRNLSFKTTEETLKNHFSSFGNIIDVNLLRRVDNKLVGCAFVEYNMRRSAVKAILSTSGKPFLGRPIIVDWAVPIKGFKKANKRSNTITGDVKEEVENDDEICSVKSEEDKKEISYVDEADDDDDVDDDDDGVDDEDDSDRNKDLGSDSSSDSDEDNNTNTRKRKANEIATDVIKKPRFESHDVKEGRTVFVKNVPYSATSDDVKECAKQFGPVLYAVVCIDPVTEHSKGSAFVKFKFKEDAEKCLSAGTEFSLNGSVLYSHEAIDRNKINEVKKKDNKNKDSRNLYLLKEGLILAGSQAAEGVSQPDMSLRLHLEQLKSQFLKNLDMFVSKNRLIIHNLPPSYNNQKLKQLFSRHSKPNAVIVEALVMRDLKHVDNKGIGISKEYGFVTFKEHEDALCALRNLNNNPNIFTNVKRPIVAFSIENLRMLNLKKKRMERSKIMNPNCSLYRPDLKKNANNKEGVNNKANDADPQKPKRNKKAWKNKKQRKENAAATSEDNNTNASDQQYVGIIAKRGMTRIRSKHKLQTQAELHHKNLVDKKKKKKLENKPKPIRAIAKDPKEKNMKRNKDLERDSHFTSLVDKYKAQLVTSDTVRKKWYE